MAERKSHSLLDALVRHVEVEVRELDLDTLLALALEVVVAAGVLRVRVRVQRARDGPVLGAVAHDHVVTAAVACRGKKSQQRYKCYCTDVERTLASKASSTQSGHARTYARTRSLARAHTHTHTHALSLSHTHAHLHTNYTRVIYTCFARYSSFQFVNNADDIIRGYGVVRTFSHFFLSFFVGHE